MLAMVRVDRVWASLLSVRLTSCAVRSRSGTFPISIVTGRSRSTCDRTVLSARPSSASAAQSSTALDTVYEAEVFKPASASAWSFFSFSRTSVLVRPVTLRRMREPSGRQPSEIAPTQVPFAASR